MPVDSQELEAFVTSTLAGISNGVNAATSNAKLSIRSPIKFEIAISATNETQLGGGLRLQVFSATGKNVAQNETISKIVFEVEVGNPNATGAISYSNKGIV